MKQRITELRKLGDDLFSKRQSLHGVWQEIALNFYPERADFQGSVSLDRDRYAQLMTGVPVMYRRDLANSLSAMLRPKDKTWFSARTHIEKVNDNSTARAFLDHVSDAMRKLMYAKDAQFIRATKQGDNDFATFGQAVISVDPNRERTGLLYRAWHIKDVAWCESDELKIDAVHHNWCYSAVNLAKKYGDKVHQSVKTAAEKEPYKEIKCRRMIIPADQYDYIPSRPTYAVRKLPFIAITIDCENDTVLEETPVKRINYVIPRWVLPSGTQYAYSPATHVALADARLLQQITLTLLEAGQKVVDPPWLAVKEAIQGPLQMFAGGRTWVDMEYDERTGEAIRQLPIDAKGLGWGGEREQIVMQMIKEALYLNQIDVPYPKGDMTATEYQGRVRDYIIRALPLFEPMETEYNGGLCELTFEICQDMLAFGPMFREMPQILSNQDIRWEFESPLQAATERAKSQAFLQSAELLKTAVTFDPSTIHDFDVSEAFRDAILGTGAPAEWLVDEDAAMASKEQSAQQAAAQQQLQGLQQGADIAAKASQAASNMGLGAKSLEGAGLV